GLGIMSNDIDLFRERINAYAADTFPVMPAKTLTLDCKLSPFYLDIDLVDNLTLLEPYGADNSQPVFGLFNMELMSVTPIGDGKHIRFEVTKKGKTLRIVKFQTTAEEFPYSAGEHIDIAVRLSKNYFKGKYYLSIQAADVRRSGIDDNKYFAEKADYELFKLGNKNKTDIFPSREICSVIYRFLKQKGGYTYTLDDLYFELGQSVTYGQLCFALSAFEDAGLINRGSSITLNNPSGKVDLESTKTLTALKGRI
ncbi:MAG: hypothetical protein K2G65_06685, partial [Eubacterium sp.]|nr:hypothetical protein [Eubacterium sp.]